MSASKSDDTSSSSALSIRGIAGGLAKVTAAITLIMTIVWAKKSDTDEKYLGGLDWDDKVFNWHPVLMVAGLLFSFGCGITSFQNTYLSKPINKALHVTSYVAAIICFGVGLKAVWKSHDNNDFGYIANLYSLHSWLGLATVVMFGQNFILGALHFLGPVTSQAIKEKYLPSHVLLGTLTIISAVIAIETGILEKNTFLGCNYSVDSRDTNPAEHYDDIPDGCKLSNGIGLMTYVTLFLIICSLWHDKPRTASNTDGLLGGGRV